MKTIAKIKLPHQAALVSRSRCLPSQGFLFCCLGVLFLDLVEGLRAPLFVLQEMDGLLGTFLMKEVVFCPVSTHFFTPGSVDGFTPGGACGDQIYMHLT